MERKSKIIQVDGLDLYEPENLIWGTRRTWTTLMGVTGTDGVFYQICDRGADVEIGELVELIPCSEKYPFSAQWKLRRLK